MNQSDLVKLRGGDFSTSSSFQTFEEVAMRIDAVKSYFGPSMNLIDDPHASMKATKEFLLNIERQVPKNEKTWDKKTVYKMFEKDTDYFFKQIIARYAHYLHKHLDDKERYEFCDHLESLVSFHKFCKEKADEV